MAIHFVFKGIDELRTGKKTAYRGQYSFDMNGNEVSCISDFYDIENLAAIEDTRFYNEPTFYKVEVGGNQSVCFDREYKAKSICGNCKSIFWRYFNSFS